MTKCYNNNKLTVVSVEVGLEGFGRFLSTQRFPRLMPVCHYAIRLDQ